MNSIHLILLKYLPLLSPLGFFGFIKTVDNHFNYSRFGFFVFVFAYWEYKFLVSEPQKEILTECYRQTKHILYPLATIFCLTFIIMFYFKWFSYNTLYGIMVLCICFLIILGIFIPQKLYIKFSKK